MTFPFIQIKDLTWRRYNSHYNSCNFIPFSTLNNVFESKQGCDKLESHYYGGRLSSLQVNFQLYYVQTLLLIIVINFSKSTSLLFASYKNIKASCQNTMVKSHWCSLGSWQWGREQKDMDMRENIKKTFYIYYIWDTKKEFEKKLGIQTGITRWMMVPMRSQ